jgi:alpha-1,3-mannosyltransferase
LWYHDYGRIAVVPSVNLEYSDDAAKKIKALKGYVSRWVSGDSGTTRIAWEAEPPELVKCMPAYSEQVFLPWDEGLPKRNATGEVNQ